MKAALVGLAIALGCGGPHGKGSHAPPPPSQEAPGFTATRWLPAKATYALSTHTLKDAQRAIKDAVSVFGFLAHLTEANVARDLTQLFGVDALSVEALRDIGVDPDGGFALFSDDVDPTLAVHLSQPDALPAFFDRLHTQGMVSQSVIVDGTEIFSAKVGGTGVISWVMQGDWILVHLAFPGVHDDSRSWVKASLHKTGASWMDTWSWANRVGEQVAKSPSLLGFIDLRKLVAASMRGADTVACVQAFSGIERVGIAFDSDGKRVDGKLTFELGGAATSVTAALLPAPPGWATASANAAIAAAWNLDLPKLASWFSPCIGALNLRSDFEALARTNVRAARGFVDAVDLANTNGVGAISVDATSLQLITNLLDKVPMRSSLERDRTWAGVAGHHLGIPFGPAVDYVLDAKHAIVAMGDDVIERVLTPRSGGAARTPVFQFDIVPGQLGKDVWQRFVDMTGMGAGLLGVLRAWHDGHMSLTVEGSALVFEARGNRR